MEAAIRALLLCEDFDCEEARQTAIRHGNDAVDLLISVLDAGASAPLAVSTDLPDETLRRRAASALGDLRSPRALGPLQRASRDANPLLRAEAARAIGRLDATSGSDALLQLLDDRDPLVRESAADALARSSSVDVLDELRTAAAREALPHVRDALERAIRTLEHP